MAADDLLSVLSALHFAWPWLALAAPLPWLLAGVLPSPAAGAALRLPDSRLIPDALGSAAAPGRWPGVLRIAAATVWLLLVFAAARPQWVDPRDRPVSGRELMVVLDLSASMATRDIVAADGQPLTRLRAAQQILGSVLGRRIGDRAGLVVFADKAYLDTPLTFDLSALRTAIEAAEIGVAGQRTAIGDAIALAVDAMRAHDDSSRVLLLFTDGAQTTGGLDPLQSAWLASRLGVRVFAVGIGAEGAAVGQATVGSAAESPAPADDAILLRIAEQTGGRFWRATEPAQLADFARELERLETNEAPLAEHPRRELYPWPLGLALLVAIALLGLAPVASRLADERGRHGH